LGIGDWGLGPIPNPQIPNPQKIMINLSYTSIIKKNKTPKSIYIRIYKIIVYVDYIYINLLKSIIIIK